MSWNSRIRQVHRWLSMVFTVAVMVNGITVARGAYNSSLGLLALLPLAGLQLSGLYLLVVPYTARIRARRRHPGGAASRSRPPSITSCHRSSPRTR